MDYKQVSQHKTADSCWVILYDNVYDVIYSLSYVLILLFRPNTAGQDSQTDKLTQVTSFLSSHPGGSKVILQLAGTDATSEYDPIHPPGTLEESLPPSAKLGSIDTSTLPAITPNPDTPTKQPSGPPPLDTLLNIDDIERAATPLLSAKAWAYYYSAADDLHSKRLNNTAYRQILLRPRVFVDCTRCDTSTSLFTAGQIRPTWPVNLKIPVFVSPAAMARLAHPSGEAGIAQACARFGAAQIISNNASLTPEQIVADATPEQVFGWQLYVQTQRAKSEAMLARIAKLPQVKFIVLTLDAPVPGKREDDERSKNVGANLPVRSAVQETQSSSLSDAEGLGLGGSDTGGLGRALFAGTAPDLTWKDTLPWLVQHTQLPIVLKGVQTHEDAYLAALASARYPQLRGIILSNHGGRAADTAPPSIHTLLEIRKYCPEVLSRIDVMLDGGIKRGTDVVKALCLGAKAVGIGRAALFGLGVGGPAGVERVLQILSEETETAMRLLGCERVDQLGPQHVNTRALDRDIYNGPPGLERQGLWEKARL